MTRNFAFGSGNGVVFAEVVKRPVDDTNPLERVYFFAKNGDPRDIWCGGIFGGELVVTNGGQIVLNQDFEPRIPQIGEKIVLIRGSENPEGRDYTKATRWATLENWNEVAWAVNAHVTYHAIASDHRNTGQFMSSTNKEITLVTGTLLSITRQYPRDAHNDPLSEGHTSSVGKLKLSYQYVRWEKLEKNGCWTECGDPRPEMALQ